jgi:hypothetical protein
MICNEVAEVMTQRVAVYIAETNLVSQKLRNILSATLLYQLIKESTSVSLFWFVKKVASFVLLVVCPVISLQESSLFARNFRSRNQRQILTRTLFL